MLSDSLLKRCDSADLDTLHRSARLSQKIASIRGDSERAGRLYARVQRIKAEMDRRPSEE